MNFGTGVACIPAQLNDNVRATSIGRCGSEGAKSMGRRQHSKIKKNGKELAGRDNPGSDLKQSLLVQRFETKRKNSEATADYGSPWGVPQFRRHLDDGVEQAQKLCLPFGAVASKDLVTSASGNMRSADLAISGLTCAHKRHQPRNLMRLLMPTHHGLNTEGADAKFCWLVVYVLLGLLPTSAAPLGPQYWARTQVGLGRMNKMKYIINLHRQPRYSSATQQFHHATLWMGWESHELGGVVQQTSTSGRGGCWAERGAPDLHAATGGCRAAIANGGTTWESRRCLEMGIDVDSGLEWGLMQSERWRRIPEQA
ncbi:hypothetical protein C8R44DRAFT_861852 [Mycena epipterygia]|nr:hypothetical protein C8R44DRAFT_861852 [Mycena epipterygia]